MDNFPSLLDKDDINGPGKGKFPRSDKGFAVDYATFKISLYLTSESPSEKLKFIRELEKLALQLGQNEGEVLFTLLETIAKDKVQYQLELSKVIVSVLNTALGSSGKSYPQLIPAVFEPLFNSTTDVLINVFNNFQELIKFIPDAEKQTWLVTTLLKLIHDESFNNTEIGVSLLSLTIPNLTAEVCSSFLYPEILAMSQGETQYKILTLDLLPPLLEKTESLDNKNKLIDLFLESCQSSESPLKLKCLDKFEKLFAICEDSVSIQKLQPAFKEFLKDKNDKVRHKAHLQLGPLLHASKAPIPHSLLELYLKLAKTVPIDKELQAHCAFFFPAIVEKMGKDGWETLSDTFLYLARSGEANTKKSCVSSLHHVFQIVGEKSHGELLRVFIEYLYDKGQRAAAMKNVEKILGSLQVESRNIVIEPVKGMVKDKSFRVRALVAEKLAGIGNLFMPIICYEHIWPICKTLCLDPIAYVRSSAMQGIGVCAVHIISEIPNYSNEIIKDLKKFGRSAKSIHRLVFASACLQLVDLVEFEAAFGDDFLILCKDKVPAVRILCAKAVKKVKSLRKFWVELKELLKTDEDNDVRKEINGDSLCSWFIVAGESQMVVKAPAVRNCLKFEEFEDAWEIQSSESVFSFMVNDVRPKHEGWIVLS